jgi:sugar O-acyltransferase (sialic acid O-acetyltransferase NeuD family)
MTRKPLLICGTRSLAVEVADVISDIPEWEVVGFVENLERPQAGATINDLPVYWIDEIAELRTTHHAVCALATTHRSRFTNEVAERGVPFATIIHPTSHVARTTTVGEGSIIGAGVIIAAHTHVGRHVFVNRGALIGHHTVIGEHCSVMPGANIAGNCRIGAATYVGMGAIVINDTEVGAHSVIGAGAVVTKTVPGHVQVVGNPARIVKENIQGK